jgi:predicted ribosomally synthesized peptide with SipW-like signal peptide
MKKSASRKALIASAAAVSLSALLFAGTTYAWFTDSESSAASTILSGNLDVNLLKGKVEQVTVEGDGEGESETKTVINYTSVGANDTVFDKVDSWEPGVVSVEYLQVKNEGSLALDYKLTVNIKNNTKGKTAAGTEIDLTTVLKAAIVPASEAYTSRADAIKAAEATAVSLSELQSATGQLLAGENGYSDYAVIVYMPETVDNTANHDGTHVPSVELGVTVEAKQSKAETDSYGNDYDGDATYSGAMKVKDGVVDNTDALNPVELADDATLTAASAEKLIIDLNSYTLSAASDTASDCLVSGTNPVVSLSNGTFVSTDAANYANIYVDGSKADSVDIVVENVNFTADADADLPYALSAVAADGSITFKNCIFNNVYSELSLQNSDSDGVTVLFENCTFIHNDEYAEDLSLIDLAQNIKGTVTFSQCYYSAGESSNELLTAENYTSIIGIQYYDPANLIFK